jgi:hypothetical protein
LDELGLDVEEDEDEEEVDVLEEVGPDEGGELVLLVLKVDVV